MSYVFWNDFVDEWRRLPIPEFTNLAPVASFDYILGWTNPNLLPLLNNPTVPGLSFEYLPEPWWGNNGTGILNSVVVNYNPGGGGNPQHFTNSRGLYGYPDYTSFVNSEVSRITKHFPRTFSWHKGKRATRIFNTLLRTGTLLNGHNNLFNHLSIELIPWHTTDTSNIGSYINLNLNEIYNNCFLFAANQSMRIANLKLKNKVILRLSGQATINLLTNMVTSAGIGYHRIINKIDSTSTKVPGGKGGYMKFEFNAIPGVEFISIWGTGLTGNDFPPDVDMDWIFRNIV